MTTSNMAKIGDKIPDQSVWRIGKNPTQQTNLREWFGQQKIVLFTLPGAFTPTCHVHHLPGYIQNRQKFLDLGVKSIVCVSVNDHFVMQAWANEQNAVGIIDFIADFDAKLTTALGLNRDLSAGGLGIRSVRSAMIIQSGLIQAIFVDEKPGQLTNTSASSILDALGA